jgi:hypothetical protein
VPSKTDEAPCITRPNTLADRQAIDLGRRRIWPCNFLF